MNAPKKQRADVHGWIALDKPLGMTSTHAVAVVRRLLNAKKAGHAGTLDPLASGLLPLAFGEATKTVPYVVDGEKAYRFTVTFGIETDTDDSEGRVVSQSDQRPSESEILAALPRFTGSVTQVPPRFSAIKIDGERAYDLARGGEAVELQPRIVEIHTLTLVSFDGQSAVLEAECGKGTYVRAIARDLERLGGAVHVVATRHGHPRDSDALVAMTGAAVWHPGMGQAPAGLHSLPVADGAVALWSPPHRALVVPDAAMAAGGMGMSPRAVIVTGADAGASTP